MPPKKGTPEVVDIGSSDDEGSVEVAKQVDNDRKSAINAAILAGARGAGIAPPPPAAKPNLESRSFWKAGNYAVAPNMKLASDSGLFGCLLACACG